MQTSLDKGRYNVYLGNKLVASVIAKDADEAIDLYRKMHSVKMVRQRPRDDYRTVRVRS